MQRLRLIPRTIIWLMEFAVTFFAYGLFIMAIVNMFTGDADSFMNGFFLVPISAIGSYIASIIAIFLGYIFNFLTKYDDYDYFDDMTDALKLAPFYLIKHAFVHLIRNFRLLFTGDIDD